ncbi:hypothetical protein T458_23970 [Brevibacillus panacihumi W25]|uniref:Uncharacterized protein n=2 Tax=Brevibacillus panacihumi TaxID=497735 RepID=V6LZB7_9BACL|nr:hypothetical protein [Brevibacillus panacihumi]EST51502.1 hypothetical protein T458_23970 [Brevibacillus panacihumi W25]RNB78623.1 hypothetical protein EDM58_10990 [Brevibacillus panacihumi]
MDFQEKLTTYIGQTVEIATGLQVTTGVLSRVTDSTATLLAASAPGYGGGQNVTFPLERITFVRVV